MKLTQSRLRKIIQEELDQAIEEGWMGDIASKVKDVAARPGAYVPKPIKKAAKAIGLEEEL